MPDQLVLTNPEPPPREQTIEERCAAFDAAHPEVYAELRRLALEAVRAGRRRLAIATIVEVETAARSDGYKLNNSYRAIWARRLMAEEPELDGAFETRERTAA